MNLACCFAKSIVAWIGNPQASRVVAEVSPERNTSLLFAAELVNSRPRPSIQMRQRRRRCRSLAAFAQGARRVFGLPSCSVQEAAVPAAAWALKQFQSFASHSFRWGPSAAKRSRARFCLPVNRKQSLSPFASQVKAWGGLTDEARKPRGALDSSVLPASEPHPFAESQ